MQKKYTESISKNLFIYKLSKNFNCFWRSIKEYIKAFLILKFGFHTYLVNSFLINKKRGLNISSLTY